MRHLGFVLALAASVILVGPLAPVASADSGQTATVTGVVDDAMSNAPVANVAVAITDGGGADFTGTTDANGAFSIPGVPAPAGYEISFQPPPQWQVASWPITVQSPGQDDLGTYSLQETPQPAGSLSGRVTDGAGRALPGMLVQVSDSGASSSDFPGSAQGQAFTGPDGTFTIPDLQVGQYDVSVTDGLGSTFAISRGNVNVASNATSTDEIAMPWPQVPAGTVTRNSARDLRWLNAERVANGLPGGIVLNRRWSTDCAAHDRYDLDQVALTHTENPNRPGASVDGAWAGMHSILGRERWTRAATSFDNAPIHLIQLFSPSLNVVGLDDIPKVDGGGFQCVTTWPGMQRIWSTDTVFTYPGNGERGFATSENAAEAPFVPGQFVGIPLGRTAGREMFVYLNQAGKIGQAQVKIRSASLTGPHGAVAVRWVDNSTPKVGPDLSGGILIPVKPLAANSRYTASVTLADGSGTIGHTWSFRTARRASPAAGAKKRRHKRG